MKRRNGQPWRQRGRVDWKVRTVAAGFLFASAVAMAVGGTGYLPEVFVVIGLGIVAVALFITR